MREYYTPEKVCESSIVRPLRINAYNYVSLDAPPDLSASSRGGRMHLIVQGLGRHGSSTRPSSRSPSTTTAR